MKLNVMTIGVLLLGGCGQQNQGQDANEPAPAAPMAPAAPSAPAAPEVSSAPNAPVAPKPPKPDDRKILIEPHGPIDPKSIEAAGQVVQHYGALIEQKRWTESRQYWSDAATPQAFERNFRTWKAVHLEIGDLGPAEGAAGSIFTNMPVTFYGDLNSGGTARLNGNVILRRVNDVDGSTAAQRRWHIERIELKR
jgi:hypothetical protein